MVDMTYHALYMRAPSEHFMLVNVSSLVGFFPMPYKAVYSSTKRFIINFSLALWKEIESFGNVTMLCPAGLSKNAESMKKIFLQGFWGKVTVQDTSVVVKKQSKKWRRIFRSIFLVCLTISWCGWPISCQNGCWLVIWQNAEGTNKMSLNIGKSLPGTEVDDYLYYLISLIFGFYSYILIL